MDNKKFCKFCGEEIDKEAIVCTKCGKQLKTIKNEQKEIKEEPVNTVQENTKFYTQTWFMWVMLIFFAPLGILFMWKFHPEMKNKTKTIITIVFALLFLIVVFNMGDTEETTTKDLNVTNNQEKTEDTSKKNKDYTLGNKIVFDELELTFDNSYSFVTLKNQFSDKNGASVIKLGVTVKNISSKKHSLNMFYYDLFGSKGTELEGVSSYFDNNIDFAGDLKPNASYKTYFYILYDGNGKYSIDFNNFTEEVSVGFQVTK